MSRDIVDRIARVCSIDGCERAHAARGWCSMHYNRLRPRKECRLDGCSGGVFGRGLCSMHFQRDLKHGSPGSPGRLRRRHQGTTYSNAHDAVRRLWGPARQYACVACGSPARHWAYDATDPEQVYGPNHNNTGWHLYSVHPEFYMPMCVTCHIRRDQAITKQELHEHRLAKYGVTTNG